MPQTTRTQFKSLKAVGLPLRVTEIKLSKIYVKLKFVFVFEHNDTKTHGRLNVKIYALLIPKKGEALCSGFFNENKKPLICPEEQALLQYRF